MHDISLGSMVHIFGVVCAFKLKIRRLMGELSELKLTLAQEEVRLLSYLVSADSSSLL